MAISKALSNKTNPDSQHIIFSTNEVRILKILVDQERELLELLNSEEKSKQKVQEVISIVSNLVEKLNIQ